MPGTTVRVLDAIADVDASAWNALAGPQPFLRHEFLHALEAAGCVGAGTGWAPRHLALERAGVLRGAMPLYLKGHSYGEYVFDWAWADAYERHGLAYYPKLLCAIPFTPVQGARLLAPDAADREALVAAALALARDTGVSSLHILFPPPDQLDGMSQAGLIVRHGVQFHWRNAGYADFEDFLARMTRDRRKKIRQERRRVADLGIRFAWKSGRDATAADWAFFTQCYDNTYREHRSTPYLNRRFFEQIASSLPDAVVLMIAERDGRPIAASLVMRDADSAYGRYWGALEPVPGLHFEACYYQPIDYCIRNGVVRFEGGAQGEHKIWRGLLPVQTGSAHWLAHPQFARAIDEHVAKERAGMSEYIEALAGHSPYRPESAT